MKSDGNDVSSSAGRSMGSPLEGFKRTEGFKTTWAPALWPFKKG